MHDFVPCERPWWKIIWLLSIISLITWHFFLWLTKELLTNLPSTLQNHLWQFWSMSNTGFNILREPPWFVPYIIFPVHPAHEITPSNQVCCTEMKQNTYIHPANGEFTNSNQFYQYNVRHNHKFLKNYHTNLNWWPCRNPRHCWTRL